MTGFALSTAFFQPIVAQKTWIIFLFCSNTASPALRKKTRNLSKNINETITYGVLKRMIEAG
jgi:hypothetical protein